MNRKQYTMTVRVRHEEGAVASAATPRRATLLFKSKEVIVALFVSMIAGCMCTTIEDQYSVADPGKSGTLRYKQYDTVAEMNSLLEYSPDVIPVVVTGDKPSEWICLLKGSGRRERRRDINLRVTLCILTLGIVPYCETDMWSYHVTVETPLGVKNGDFTQTRRWFWGFVPWLLPFATFENSKPFGDTYFIYQGHMPECKIKTDLADETNELVRRVVSQFKSEWTPQKVAALNTAERSRIGAKRNRADELLAAKDWKAVVALCEGEKDMRFVDEYKQKAEECRQRLRRAEKRCLAEVEKSLSGLLEKNEYDKAEKLLSEAYAKWRQVDGHDSDAWKRLGDMIAVRKEEFRVASKCRHIEELFAQEKFAEILTECASEGEGFADMVSKAKAKMKEQELARIDKKKKVVEELINAGKYDDVIVECDKEIDVSNLADRLIWRDYKLSAIRKKLSACQNAVSKDRIKEILALAKKSAEENSNINFFGFFVGMSQYDAFALTEHYGLKEEEFSISVAENGGVVNQIWFSLKGIRRIAKKGDTFNELLRVVERQIGDLSVNVDSAVNDAFSASLSTVFSGGNVPLSVPKAKYVRETIGGVVAMMYDGANAGLNIAQKNPKERTSIATDAAKQDRESNTYNEVRKMFIDEVRKMERDRIILGILNNMIAIPGMNFKIGKYEVTQAQWEAMMGNNPSKFKNSNNPVENVSWNDCQEFIRKLNAMPEVKASGLTFRLPTESEWEYACRAGSTGDYCKLADGTEITMKTLSEVAWYGDNSGRMTHPVGQKKPNAFGLYDMHGNVWELCQDLYEAGASRREYLGGSWDDFAVCCSASYRCSNFPDYPYSFGFRLAASQDVNR